MSAIVTANITIIRFAICYAPLLRRMGTVEIDIAHSVLRHGQHTIRQERELALRRVRDAQAQPQGDADLLLLADATIGHEAASKQGRQLLHNRRRHEL
jgi:hypothetical protein